MTNAQKRPRRESSWAYQVMVWTFKVQDFLGIGKPQPRLAKAPLGPGMTVADWGCGPGRYTIPAAKVVGPQGKVYAVDVAPLAIKIVKEKAAKEGLANVEPILVDSYTSPIQSSSVDLVLLLDVFHGIDDRMALLREISRVLKPDGRLFMDPGHMNLAAAKQAIEESGLFDILETEGNLMLLLPKAQTR